MQSLRVRGEVGLQPRLLPDPAAPDVAAGVASANWCSARRCASRRGRSCSSRGPGRRRRRRKREVARGAARAARRAVGVGVRALVLVVARRRANDAHRPAPGAANEPAKSASEAQSYWMSPSSKDAAEAGAHEQVGRSLLAARVRGARAAVELGIERRAGDVARGGDHRRPAGQDGQARRRGDGRAAQHLERQARIVLPAATTRRRVPGSSGGTVAPSARSRRAVARSCATSCSPRRTSASAAVARDPHGEPRARGAARGRHQHPLARGERAHLADVCARRAPTVSVVVRRRAAVRTCR